MGDVNANLTSTKNKGGDISFLMLACLSLKNGGIMRKSVRIILCGVLCLFFAFALAACGSGGSSSDSNNNNSSFSDASMGGAWFIDVSSSYPGETSLYIVCDGAGVVDDHSMIHVDASGTYDVTSVGAFTVNTDVGTADEQWFMGDLNSDSAGTVTSASFSGGAVSWPMVKVSALEGTLAGTMTETCAPADAPAWGPELCDGTVYDVTGLIINASGVATGGAISDGTDTFDITSGGAFASGGDVVIKLDTTASGFYNGLDAYGITRIAGTLTGTDIAGAYEVDSGMDVPAGAASLTLTP
jgi:hypothetical protein